MTTSASRGMTPEDLYAITFIGGAEISPDGRHIAFVQTRMDKEKDEYLGSIHVIASEGGDATRFTSGGKRDTAPRWSPDGRWLAFLSNRDTDKSQIWLMATDGGEARRLTNLKQGAGSIVWSPDSRRLAFVSRVAADAEAEDEAEEKGGEKRKKTERARIVSNLKYKMNGEGFTYNRRPHIFTLSIDGGEPEQLTFGEFNDSGPAWSPDGKSIAFSAARHESREFDSISDIYVMAAAGGEPRRITPGHGPSHDPAFSPDGATIAYYGHEDPQAGGARNTRLWVVPTAGGEPRDLTGALDRTIAGGGFAETGGSPPVWTPDGGTIFFGLADRGAAGIRAVPAAGGAVRTVAGGNRAISSWSVSADGTRIAYVASDPTNPGDLYVTGAQAGGSNGAGEHRLTHVNDAWLREVQLSAPEEFTYQSVDGWTVEGWIVKPFGYQEGSRYPLLLNVHGGPHAFYGWGFFDEFQVQGGAGYAVLYTNPRGSQSYGEEFAYACTRDWGGKDFQDVMNGLDEALKRYRFIDSDRLGVLGGSYGGFMTSWTVGHTNRFKAAVSERAVNALYSMFGSSDIGYHFQQFEVGGTPQDALDFYIERSPVTYAAQMRTPLMIMHSENDLRCPMEQAEQLYVTLKVLRQTEVVFVRFPEESHELSRGGKPSRRVERFQIILDWFDRYLRAGQGTARVERLAEAIGAPA